MTAERANPTGWRRRRADAPEAAFLAPQAGTESVMVEPVPLHRPQLTGRDPISGGSWAGRVSDHRRAQVRSRGPEPVWEGPTGPVQSRRSAESADPLRTRVEQAWTLVVQVLGHEVGALSSALLCTADGRALAAHGLADPDVPGVARVTSAVVVAGSELAAARHDAQQGGVETVQLSSGQTHTVVASIPVPGHDALVLSVTAESVSLGVMLVQTRQAADGLRELLSAID